jgi:Sec-independent protein translocase protein TatA
VGPELLLLLVVLIIVLVWRGPSTLPRLGEAAGKAVSSVRQGLRSRDHPSEPDETDDASQRTDH